MTFERKYRDPVTARPTARLTLATNNPPPQANLAVAERLHHRLRWAPCTNSIVAPVCRRSPGTSVSAETDLTQRQRTPRRRLRDDVPFRPAPAHHRAIVGCRERMAAGRNSLQTVLNTEQKRAARASVATSACGRYPAAPNGRKAHRAGGTSGGDRLEEWFPSLCSGLRPPGPPKESCVVSRSRPSFIRPRVPACASKSASNKTA
jgi:hypothetical protein